MSKLKLKVQTRKSEEKVPELRRSGTVPAVLYGPGMENLFLKLNKVEFDKLFNAIGESTMIDLVIDDNNTETVLVKSVQRGAFHGNVLHVDFFRPSQDKKVVVRVPLEFAGQPKTVKEMGGILLVNLETLKIKCLPKYLMNKVVIDLTELKTFSDSIKVKDIKLEGEVEVLDNPNNVITTTISPKVKAENDSKKEEK